MSLISTTCTRCSSVFEMDDNLYLHRKAHKSKIICPACLAKSKEDRYKKIGQSMKSTWASYNKEERQHRIANAKSGIHNMSSEAKARRSERSSKATRQVMSNLSDDERKSRSVKISNANRRRYAEMSEEKRCEIGNHISVGLNARSAEDKAKSNKQRSESLSRTIANMSSEELAERNQRVQEWWDNLTPEEFQKWKANQASGYSKYIENLSIVPNSNEQALMNYFNANKLTYDFQSLNTSIHPDFTTLFPFNPVTGSIFINPYHKWDFRVKTLSGDVFVDIDGSIHFNESYISKHPSTGAEYNLLDYYKFKDSQRLYQTDGLPSYVVLCPDDQVTPNTVVRNLYTDEKMTLQSFLVILQWMNMSKKEQKRMLKDAI